METIAKPKKWGNSIGIIIPNELAKHEGIKANQKVRLLLLKDSSKVLRESFGMLKGKSSKSAQEIKDELRRELYD